MRRLVALVAISAGIAGGGFAPAAWAGDVPARTTTITMRVANCVGCTVQPVLERFDADGKVATYSGRTTRVRDGVAVMRVPTDTTPGMSFRISGPRREEINAAPLIVVQYKGYKPGTVVTKAQAKAAKQASACWAGTSRSSVTLRVQAATVLMDAFLPEGATTRVTMGWLVPTAKAPGNFDQTFKGVLATQEIGAPCDAG